MVVTLDEANSLNPGELEFAMREMPEYSLWKELESIHQSLYIFRGNYEELAALLRTSTNPSTSAFFQGIENNHHAQEELSEITRLLHNFVAAVKSLVDHTRNLHRSLFESEGLFKDYQPRVNSDFKEHELAKFVQEMRDYVLHYELPPVIHRTTFKDNDLSMTVNLSKSKLLESSFNFGEKAKAYLNSHQDNELDLSSLLAVYFEHVMKFYQWFLARGREEFSTEFERLHNADRRRLIVDLHWDLRRFINSEIEKNYDLELEFFYCLSPAEYQRLKTAHPTNKSWAALACLSDWPEWIHAEIIAAFEKKYGPQQRVILKRTT